jgi:hypothetical protein
MCGFFEDFKVSWHPKAIKSSWAISHVLQSKSLTFRRPSLSPSSGNGVVGNHHWSVYMHLIFKKALP